jgi:phosphate-selective porin OprO/OprP
MHGSISGRRVCLLLVVLLSAEASTAWGQQQLHPLPSPDYTAPTPLPDPAYALSARTGRFAGRAYLGQEPNTLADRVAELEAEIDELKAFEAKTKAVKYPTISVGGRVMVDWANFSQNAASKAQAGDFENGLELRRTRVYLKGDVSPVVDYKLQFELASRTTIPDFPGIGQSFGVGQVGFKDVYLTIKELPVLGHVRIGHFKTPFGLENLTSHRFATFMERAMISEGELEGRRAGIMAFNHTESERSTWAIALVTTQIPENPPIFKNDNGGVAVITRYSFLPWYDEATEGRGLLHTAVSYAHGDIAGGNAVRFVERPEAHLANTVIDTGTLEDVAAINTLGTELAMVYGPLSLQSEFLSYWVDRTDNPSPFFYGAYAYVSYFLTGENRRYKRTSGTFDRIKPYEDFFRVRTCDGSTQMGIGAWELAYRYSFLDLNSSNVNGGWAGIHTFGVNWYLNPYTRVMFNYVHSEAGDHPDAPGVGLADIFQMRAQVDF